MANWRLWVEFKVKSGGEEGELHAWQRKLPLWPGAERRLAAPPVPSGSQYQAHAFFILVCLVYWCCYCYDKFPLGDE